MSEEKIPTFTASTLSALAGHHFHVPRERAILDTIHEYMPDEWGALCRRYGIIGTWRDVASAVAQRAGIHELSSATLTDIPDEDATAAIAAFQTRVGEQVEAIAAAAREPAREEARDIIDEAGRVAPLSETFVQEVANEAGGKWQKKRGVALEASTNELLEAEGYVVKNDQSLLRRTFAVELDEVARKFTLLGRADVIVSDGARVGIGEIKNRVSQFRNNGYDLDQLAAYIAMTKYKFGALIQRCRGQIKVTWYQRETLIARFRRAVHDLGPAFAMLDAVYRDAPSPSVCVMVHRFAICGRARGDE